MRTIILTSFFWFFAIIGFCELVRRFLMFCLQRNEKTESNILLTAFNEEEVIEQKIRSIVYAYHRKGALKVPRIIIVDLGSTDDTLTILHKLETEYSFVHPMTKEEYLDYCRQLFEN